MNLISDFMDDRFVLQQFPRASAYHPEWIISGASGGANSLWLTEWLTEVLDLKPGMRVLDLGCGRGCSSIFLHREFGVQVWATDLWFNATEKLQRIRDADAENGVFPIHADARSLPFADGFFDVIISIDSFIYYGTDDLYLNYIARFLKPGGILAIAGSGLTREIEGAVPKHLQEWWTADLGCLHSDKWWQRHWEKAGILKIEIADVMHEGWKRWRDWIQAIAPENHLEIHALEGDHGQYLGYVRSVGRLKEGIQFEEPIVSVPIQYEPKPLLRNSV
ncbi:MAG: methyltransferase domain-containing protein [Bacteroidia bacterium]